MFSNPDTYVGNYTDPTNGDLNYVYNTTVTLGAFNITIALFLDATTNVPAQLHMYPGDKGFIGDSHLYYKNFQVASGFPAALLTPPSDCSTSQDEIFEPQKPLFPRSFF